MTNEEIEQLLDLLNAHRRTTGIALIQRAKAGKIHIAPSVEQTIDEGRNAIKKIKDTLNSVGHHVEHLPIIDDADDILLGGTEELSDLQNQIKSLEEQVDKPKAIWTAIITIFTLALIVTIALIANGLGATRKQQEIQPTLNALQAELVSLQATAQVTATYQIFVDNFRDKRPSDPVPLSTTQTKAVSLTTEIENGKLKATGKVGGYKQRMYSTNTNFKDFELTIDVSSLRSRGGGEFFINFRGTNDKWNYYMGYFFVLEISDKGDYVRAYELDTSIWLADEDNGYKRHTIVYKDINVKPLVQLKIICKSDTCDFYINSQKIYSDKGFHDVPGDISIDVDGDYDITLDQIMITPMN